MELFVSALEKRSRALRLRLKSLSSLLADLSGTSFGCWTITPILLHSHFKT